MIKSIKQILKSRLIINARTLVIGLFCAAVISACGDRDTDTAKVLNLAVKPLDFEEGESVRFLTSVSPQELSSNKSNEEGRLQIGRGADYVPINEDSLILFNRLRDSMKRRRAVGWQVFESMLAPQRMVIDDQAIDIPLWHTWYEGMAGSTEQNGNFEVQQIIDSYIKNLKDCSITNCGQSNEEIAENTIKDFSEKDFEKSLSEENLTRNLNQLDGLVKGDDEFSEHLGRGFTLFSPSFVKHVLGEAQGIEECLLSSIPPPASNAPPRSEDQFSDCIDEFPRSAVMIKTNWSRIDGTNADTRAFDTSGSTLRSRLSQHNGKWQEEKQEFQRTTNSIYSVQDNVGQLYGLNAIHISTKDTREWLWISLWWDPTPSNDFGADRPASISRYNQGVWTNYKMCVTSAFIEGDVAPWISYENSNPSLADALRGTHDASKKEAVISPPSSRDVTSWCSNPYLEGHTNNDKTNCIGCHQFSVTGNENPLVASKFARFYDTIWLSSQSGASLPSDQIPTYRQSFPQYGRSRIRSNFPADFAWSTMIEFPFQINEARSKHNFDWPKQ